MQTLNILTTEGKKTKRKVTLVDSIFNVKVNNNSLYQDIRRYMNRQRQGNASTKQRSDVKGSSAKAYRQKGTGMARRGSMKSPLLRGGGITFGPQKRTYHIEIPKKLRIIARYSALTLKNKKNLITVSEKLSLEEPKTKSMVEFLKNLNINDKKVLILTNGNDINIYRSTTNLKQVKTLEVNKLNSYEIMQANYLLFFEDALETLQKPFLKTQSVDSEKNE